MKTSTKSGSPEETQSIAFSIGKKLKGGEAIELTGEMGGGKTTFTHGLASAIESNDKVASPTFTVSKLYVGRKFDIHHFDFYRLGDPGLMKYQILEVIENSHNVVVIEWPEIIEDILPDNKLTIEFKYLNDDKRQLLFTYPKSLSYLVEDYVKSSN